MPKILSRKIKKNENFTKKTKKKPQWKSEYHETFSKETNHKIKYLQENPTLPNEEERLFENSFSFQEHQKLVKNYINPATPYRGLLLYHGLGSGKTCSSIAISEGLRFGRKCVVLSPASLENNFRKELETCGNIMYTRNSKWTLVEASKNNLPIQYRKIHPDLQKIWVAHKKDENIGEDFLKLSVENQKEIEKQIKIRIDYTYTFLHYDGVNMTKLTKMITEKILDNKTLIVDEVHNLISMISGSGNLGALWYKLIMTAHNLRIVFLSGTPVVNYPHEFAVLFNMLRGYIDVYNFEYEQNRVENVDAKTFIDHMNTSPFVDFVQIKEKYISLKKPPINYKVDKDGNFIYDTNNITHTEWIKEMKELASSKGFVLKKETHVKYTCFPEDFDDFNDTFINYQNQNIIKSEIFMRRILGMVSYYIPEKKESDFPKQYDTEIVKCPMTINQYTIYEKIRLDEIQKSSSKSQKNQKNKKKGVNLNDRLSKKQEHEDSTFRIFSREACNMVYPSEISRPISRTEEQTLEQLKVKAMQDFTEYLDTQKDTDLDKIVKNISPKYFILQDKLKKAPGTCLVYSVFRFMEGIDSITKILDRYNWKRLNIRKSGGMWEIIGLQDPDNNKNLRYMLYTGTETPEEREILKNIYNNNWNALPQNIKKELDKYCKENSIEQNNLYGKIVKTLIITKAGAEGITLKNVRQVHLIENHWNNVRRKQVIGRAVRFESHKDLPLEDRNVRVYQYVTVFGNEVDKMKEEPAFKISIENLQEQDKNETSDEFIFNLAKRKEILNDHILNLVQKASIDCLSNNITSNCLVLSNQSTYSFDPDIKEHLKDTDRVHKKLITMEKLSANTLKKFPLKLQHENLLWNKNNNKIYNEKNPSISIGIYDGIKFIQN